MFSIVHCNRRSLQCLPHRNVRIAHEWNALALSIGTHRDPALACTIPFFSSFFTFSPFQAMPPGLDLKTNIDYLTNNKTRSESNTANDRSTTYKNLHTRQ